MKQKAQLRYLFVKQVQDNETRHSVQHVHMILKVNIRDNQFWVFDGVNHVPLITKCRKLKLPDPTVKKSVSALEDGATYLFTNCKMDYRVEGPDVVIFMEAGGWAALVPAFEEDGEWLPQTMEKDLEEYEVELIKRKV